MYFKGFGRSGPSTLRDFFNIFLGNVPRRLPGPFFSYFFSFFMSQGRHLGSKVAPKCFPKLPKWVPNRHIFDVWGQGGPPGAQGYPPATPNLQNIDKNHKIHSKYTSQNTTNNVRHISKKKIQNGTAGYFWTLEIIYISIVGKSSTSIPPSL